MRFRRVDPFPSSGQKSKAITGRSIRARIVVEILARTYACGRRKEKGRLAEGLPHSSQSPREDSKGERRAPREPSPVPGPATLRARARTTEIRRVSSPFGNTLRDCESIVRSHPRSGLTWSYCDETSTVPPKEARGSPETSILTLGIRRDPAHLWAKFCPFRWPGTKSRRYIDDFFLRTRERVRKTRSSEQKVEMWEAAKDASKKDVEESALTQFPIVVTLSANAN